MFKVGDRVEIDFDYIGTRTLYEALIKLRGYVKGDTYTIVEIDSYGLYLLELPLGGHLAFEEEYLKLPKPCVKCLGTGGLFRKCNLCGQSAKPVTGTANHGAWK